MEPGSRAGSAYLVVPDDGPGHGVLVLHSWWGLTPTVKAVVERLADAGYTALAPDLLAGAAPDDPDDARQVLADSDPNETAALILSSVVALRANSADPRRRGGGGRLLDGCVMGPLVGDPPA